MRTAPLVSVVTPFHNTGAHLGECIESVLRQTHSNWEYVLVDNCSSDRASDIAAEYTLRHPEKLRLIRTPWFLTQVQNYNFALSCVAPGAQYCKIVQADDWLFPECIERMVAVAETHPSVGIVAGYLLESDRVQLSGLPYASVAVAGRDACRLFLVHGKYLFGSPTSTLIRSDLLATQRPFFEERLAPFEDAHAYFTALRTWNFGFVHQVVTFSRRDDDSMLSKVERSGLLHLSRLSIVVEHGRDFLSDEEYGRALRRAEREYFVYLTRCACARKRQPREFWESHRRGLASIRYSFDWRQLVKWLPRSVAEKVWEGFWTRWDGEPEPHRV
jgi:glycosyltransferase involved in cell wall biosynthesis